MESFLAKWAQCNDNLYGALQWMTSMWPNFNELMQLNIELTLSEVIAGLMLMCYSLIFCLFSHSWYQFSFWMLSFCIIPIPGHKGRPGGAISLFQWPMRPHDQLLYDVLHSMLNSSKKIKIHDEPWKPQVVFIIRSTSICSNFLAHKYWITHKFNKARLHLLLNLPTTFKVEPQVNH